jgi:hypothetical protein
MQADPPVCDCGSIHIVMRRREVAIPLFTIARLPEWMGAYGVGVAVGHDVSCSRSHPTFCMVKHAASVTTIPRVIAIKKNFIPCGIRFSRDC